MQKGIAEKRISLSWLLSRRSLAMGNVVVSVVRLRWSMYPARGVNLYCVRVCVCMCAMQGSVEQDR